MGYRIKRVDLNQKSIVSEFRAIGCHVLILSEMGRGIPDILVGIPLGDSLKLVLIEIKNGDKPPSGQKLTPDEQTFHDLWKGGVFIIKNVTEVHELVEKARSNDLN